MSHEQVTKVGNALIPNPPIALWARLLLLWAVLPSMWHSGGLWVGGRLTFAGSRLSFEPNTLNRAFLAGDVAFAIDLADFQSVRVEGAVGTDIIVLSAKEGERRFRCLGAKELAATIEAARNSGQRG